MIPMATVGGIGGSAADSGSCDVPGPSRNRRRLPVTRFGGGLRGTAEEAVAQGEGTGIGMSMAERAVDGVPGARAGRGQGEGGACRDSHDATRSARGEVHSDPCSPAEQPATLSLTRSHSECRAAGRRRNGFAALPCRDRGPTRRRPEIARVWAAATEESIRSEAVPVAFRTHRRDPFTPTDQEERVPGGGQAVALCLL